MLNHHTHTHTHTSTITQTFGHPRSHQCTHTKKKYTRRRKEETLSITKYIYRGLQERIVLHSNINSTYKLLFDPSPSISLFLSLYHSNSQERRKCQTTEPAKPKQSLLSRKRKVVCFRKRRSLCWRWWVRQRVRLLVPILIRKKTKTRPILVIRLVDVTTIWLQFGLPTLEDLVIRWTLFVCDSLFY